MLLKKFEYENNFEHTNPLQACIDVKFSTLIEFKLFDWDRTGDPDPLGRFALLLIFWFVLSNTILFLILMCVFF